MASFLAGLLTGAVFAFPLAMYVGSRVTEDRLVRRFLKWRRRHAPKSRSEVIVVKVGAEDEDPPDERRPYPLLPRLPEVVS